MKCITVQEYFHDLPEIDVRREVLGVLSFDELGNDPVFSLERARKKRKTESETDTNTDAADG